jgi:hypothetical protein
MKERAYCLDWQAGCPQLHTMPAFFASASQQVLQYLLSIRALQWQAGMGALLFITHGNRLSRQEGRRYSTAFRIG